MFLTTQITHVFGFLQKGDVKYFKIYKINLGFKFLHGVAVVTY